MSDSSPMMIQYERIKRQHPDALLFFRLGDFYEMFRLDAIEGSRLLGLTLTQRQSVPMCGIPYHAAEGYIQKLMTFGKKVAICEQVSVPTKGKGLVDREVIEVLSPGTVVDDAYLDGAANNYLVSISSPHADRIALAYLDLSTGELGVRAFAAAGLLDQLSQDLAKRSPKELIVQESLLNEGPGLAAFLATQPQILINRYPDWQYSSAQASQELAGLFGTTNLSAFGLVETDERLHPVSTLLQYAREAARSPLHHLRGIQVELDADQVALDEASIRNLELVRNLRDGGRAFSLLWAIDQTQTPMGARLIRRWILEPSRNLPEIQSRLEVVERLYHQQPGLARLREVLGAVRDVERLVTRVRLDRAGPKDLVGLGTSVAALIELQRQTAELGLDGLWDASQLATAAATVAAIGEALVDNPPFLLSDGDCIRPGYDAELDGYRRLASDNQSILDDYLTEERTASNVPTLKIGQNRVIGYYLEVSRSQSAKLPSHFIRKHSTLHAERFTTERLMELEAQIASAVQQSQERQHELFSRFRQDLKPGMTAVLGLAQAGARLDVLAAFAWQATVRGYVRPEVIAEVGITIVQGRHPVVEACLDGASFVPNDCQIGGPGDPPPRTVLLTGPNMAGKSTYLRQAALIVLLAQMGSFVPAESARIGLVDRIFCRVGASDNLAGGESTFLVEMNEAARILRGATPESLIIMDEVGRGTSTQDGLAIAQAILEYIAEELRCSCLFATHYHELTSLAIGGVVNYSMAVHEEAGTVTFLKSVQPGPSSKSFGIHVAKLAGVPPTIIKRANQILAQRGPTVVPMSPVLPSPMADQGSLFGLSEELEQLVRNFRVNDSSPLDALSAIAAWQKIISPPSKTGSS